LNLYLKKKQEQEVAPSVSPADSKVPEKQPVKEEAVEEDPKLQDLFAMGFCDRELNIRLLKKEQGQSPCYCS